MTALATDPADRYPDGAALSAAIRSLPGSPDEERIVAAAIDTPTEVIPSVGVRPASVRPSRADRPGLGRRPWAWGALGAAVIVVAAVGMAAGGDPAAVPAADPAASTPAEPSAAKVTPPPETAKPPTAGEHGKSEERGKGKDEDKDDEKGDD